jgi:FAD/FMN-containing dehydrogenase
VVAISNRVTRLAKGGRLSEADIGAFRTSLCGELISPADEGYEQARKVHNAMIDKRPMLVARCMDVADVIACVGFAADHGLPLAIRGGGHNGAGLGTVDDGLVADLGKMRSVHVDPKRRTARVEGGCVLGDVDHATHVFGMATPFGINSSTGVGGLTLGGGIGHLTRKYGLSIDNLISADVVLADGRLVTASADEHPDLFWALRGGGGNFGVVTSFLFQLHPVNIVYAGPMFWPLEQAEAAMHLWWETIQSASEDLSGFFNYHIIPPGPPFPEQYHNQNMCGVVWCYTGPPEKAEEVFKPIRRFGPPAIDLVGPIPYPALQTMFDPLFLPGNQWYWKADFVKGLTNETIALNVRYGSQVPTFRSGTHLYAINGAAHRVGQADTAFSYRDADYCQVMVAVEPDPSVMQPLIDWAKSYWTALHPYSAGGAYINMMMEEGEDRVRAAYRGNYDRLSRVKAEYDPHNLFKVNQNIKPAV